jgi:hypothetical protein
MLLRVDYMPYFNLLQMVHSITATPPLQGFLASQKLVHNEHMRLFGTILLPSKDQGAHER